VHDVRGRGLMCAFSMPTTTDRDELLRRLWQNGVIVLPSGQVSVRFRPALTVARAEIDETIAALRDVFTVR
jgi:L-lysine 6-transaminase